MIIPDDNKVEPHDGTSSTQIRATSDEVGHPQEVNAGSESVVEPILSGSRLTGANDAEELAPPRYEDITNNSFTPVPPSPLYEKDPRRVSLATQSSGLVSSTELQTNPLISAALEASPAFQPDGRFQVSIDSPLFGMPRDYCSPVNESAIDLLGFKKAPAMNVNIMIVGSRGDVQPYLALGRQLQGHGHTVRLTTHENFRQQVKDAGLQFFNIGGHPHELMSYMVPNPGTNSETERLTKEDLTRKQMVVAEMLERCWRSCYEPDKASEGGASFVADAIISNPPTFAHIHCAEALGIPLLMSFTMPWSPTTAFPHPLVNVKDTKAEAGMTNYLTYRLADLMSWQGLGPTINKFRRKRLGLQELSVSSGAKLLEHCNVPWTYCISPALVPKPEDWMNHIDVAGFYFSDHTADYTPPSGLETFINAGAQPIYVGFGSVIVQDRQNLTKTVLAAIAQANVRAVVSAGSGGLDIDILKDPSTLAATGSPDIFVVGEVPHHWLFEKVSAVCHHGGAGTTAIGLRYGKPTVIIPFFGDQPWWGNQIHAHGAGPNPIPHNQLTTTTLAQAFQTALSEDVKLAARDLGDMVMKEDGTGNGVDSFHRHLPLKKMRCDLDSNRIAVWCSRSLNLRLSAFAAQVLSEHGIVDVSKLELHRSREYLTRSEATDPISGTLLPALGIVGDLGAGVGHLLSVRPDKGAIKLAKAVPDTVRGTIGGLHQGLKNSPKIYGSSVREPGKVTDFRSGMKEGGKSLAFGLYDGLSDIVREPIKGFKRGGIVGAAGGVVTGLVNAALKPSAGVVGLLTHPMEGTAASTRTMMAKPARERHGTRRAEGLAAFESSSEVDRRLIMSAFEARKGKWKGKKKALPEGQIDV